MLQEIYIENLAVIQKAIIPLSNSLNAFTGETGAGKSILINGINAVLGQRVTKDIVRTGCKKAIVTALFTQIGDATKSKLKELAIDFEDNQITITREIQADGGSIARVNSRAVTISVLKEIGETLITIHGQHDNQILLAPEKHIQVLDNFGGDFTLLNDYMIAFKNLQLTARKLEELKKLEKDKAEKLEILNAKINEIEAFNLKENEDDEIEEEFTIALNADNIARTFRNVYEILNGNDDENAVEYIRNAENNIYQYSDVSNKTTELYERICAVGIEIKDISEELSDVIRGLNVDPKRFEYIAKRRDSLNRLKKKYNAEISDIIEIYNQAVLQVQKLESSAFEIERMNEQKENLLLEVTEKAKNLSSYRKDLAQKFAEKVMNELKFLNMPNVIIEVKIIRGKLTINGMDNVEFLISANKGEPPKPIAKIASGGELSRIMLALKCVIADKDSIPTMIFDEIDTGVSGSAAQKIGIKLREIGKIRQVLCVTHLTQIAVMADNHLLIEKNTIDERTVTDVSVLDFEGRVKEIARIMGGENPSELMIKNAKQELLNIQNI